MKRPFLLLTLVATLLAEHPPLGEKGRTGLEMLGRNNDKATRLLLEAVESETPKHPQLLEALGLAYLGQASSLDRDAALRNAENWMNQSLEAGGRAAIIVDRALKREKNILKVKRGKLILTKQALIFEPEPGGDHTETITIAASEITRYGFSDKGKSTNFFEVEAKKVHYDFRTENFSNLEAELIFRLMEKHMGVSSKDSKKRS